MKVPAPSLPLPPLPPEPESPGEIVARPDGYHWLAPDGRQEFGPFKTMQEAVAYRDAFEGEATSPGETLREAEDELGIADWIDPQTGALAEGSCPPRLDEE